MTTIHDIPSPETAEIIDYSPCHGVDRTGLPSRFDAIKGWAIDTSHRQSWINLARHSAPNEPRLTGRVYTVRNVSVVFYGRKARYASKHCPVHTVENIANAVAIRAAMEIAEIEAPDKDAIGYILEKFPIPHIPNDEPFQLVSWNVGDTVIHHAEPKSATKIHEKLLKTLNELDFSNCPIVEMAEYHEDYGRPAIRKRLDWVQSHCYRCAISGKWYVCAQTTIGTGSYANEYELRNAGWVRHQGRWVNPSLPENQWIKHIPIESVKSTPSGGWVFHGNGPNYFGIELEVESWDEAAKGYDCSLPLKVRGCSDGSLRGSSLELNFHPMDETYAASIADQFDTMCRSMRDNGATTENCGVHVHCSKDMFDLRMVPLIAKWLGSFSIDWLWKFHRRKSLAHFVNWADPGNTIRRNQSYIAIRNNTVEIRGFGADVFLGSNPIGLMRVIGWCKFLAWCTRHPKVVIGSLYVALVEYGNLFDEMSIPERGGFDIDDISPEMFKVCRVINSGMSCFGIATHNGHRVGVRYNGSWQTDSVVVEWNVLSDIVVPNLVVNSYADCIRMRDEVFGEPSADTGVV